MKIEIGESLGYSYLRHVKRCWLVQTNWKVSEHWPRYKSDAELETMFRRMKQEFDEDGKVFKETKNAGQFLKQGEIDLVGIDLQGDVHALEVAFHESGLNYGGGSDNRVLKKLLRTFMILQAYQRPETKFHISFASPKVNPTTQKPLEDVFIALRNEYPKIDWNLITNDDFTAEILQKTLEATETIADSSELFVRAAKLLNLTGIPAVGAGKTRARQTTKKALGTEERLQPIVEDIMKTLLEDHPTLLEDAERDNLMDREYCKRALGLKISNFALLRQREDGREVNGHSRYWKRPYADKFYVCSEWWKDDHIENAGSLARFATRLAARKPDDPGVPALKEYIKRLDAYASRRRRDQAKTMSADNA